jgi:hypothetical protein
LGQLVLNQPKNSSIPYNVYNTQQTKEKNKIYTNGMRELPLEMKRFEDGKEWKTPQPESGNFDSGSGSSGGD